MSVVDNLNQIKSCKENIKQAIIDKGVDMTGVVFTEYASKISEIQTGEGGGDYLDIKENLTTYNSNREYIPDYAFVGCNLQSVNLPKCKKIGQYAFEKTPLTTIDLPECEEVGNNVFYYSFLETVNLPKCKSIRDMAFYYSKLSTINLPECENITYGGFMGCENLTTVDLPVCKTLSNDVFSYCYALSTINLPECEHIESTGFNYTALTEVVLPKCKKLGYSSLNNCEKLTSVDLPVCRNVGAWAFEFSRALQRVNIPICSSIDENAFGDCQSLTEVDLSKSYYCILQNEDCFYNSPISNGNGSIYVHNSVLERFRNATNWTRYADCFVGVGDANMPLLEFHTENWTEEEEIGVLTGETEYIGGDYKDALGINTQVKSVFLFNVKEITENVFENNDLYSIDITSCEKISNRAFAGSRIDNINAPEVKVIDREAFSGSRIYFQDEMFPECVEIGYAAFYSVMHTEYEESGGWVDVSFPKCKKIGDISFANTQMDGVIRLPECVEIGNEAFMSSYFGDYEIPNCEIIGRQAFYYCGNLNSLYLEKCKKIGYGAFEGCNNIRSLHLLGDTVVELEDPNIGGLYNTNIYVPQKLLESYKNDPNWANYADRIVGY